MTLVGPVRFQGKFGFISADGEWMIAPTFEELGEMHEGLASFAQGGKLGFVNKRGEVKIEPQFDIPSAGCWGCGFSEGLAAVARDRKLGYVNATGEFVIAPEADAIGWDFMQGRAIVSSPPHGYMVIDKAGRRLAQLEVYDIPCLPQWPKDWDCFNCLFRVEQRFLAGAINWQGQVVFPPKYAGLGEFYSGVAMFAVEEEHRHFGPQGLVRVDGTVIVEPSFRNIGDFSGGLAPASQAKKRCGFIDTRGEFVIPPVYELALPFEEGLACVTVKGKHGFINVRGEMVIEPRFRRQGSFRNGFAWMEYEGMAGYIDRSGRAIWERPLEFDAQYKLWL